MFGIAFDGDITDEEIAKIKKFGQDVMLAIKGTAADDFLRDAESHGLSAMLMAANAVSYDIMTGYSANQTAQEVAAIIAKHAQEARDEALLESLPDTLPMH